MDQADIKMLLRIRSLTNAGLREVGEQPAFLTSEIKRLEAAIANPKTTDAGYRLYDDAAIDFAGHTSSIDLALQRTLGSKPAFDSLRVLIYHLSFTFASIDHYMDVVMESASERDLSLTLTCLALACD